MKKHHLNAVLALSASLATAPLLSYAAGPVPPTDAGRILQESKPAPAAPGALPPPIQAPATPKQAVPEGAGQDVRVKVTEFKFSGNSVISEEKLLAAVAEWSGKSLNFGELLQVTDRIETLYHDAGYFLAQATLPPQQIRDGAISIVITEGRLGKTRLEGESRISPDTINKYLDRLPKGEVVTEGPLNRQTLLINDLSGGQASLDMQAGEEAGTTDLVLEQKATPLFTGRINADNFGMPATGEHRVGINAALNSPLHVGDRLSGNVVATGTGNLHTYGLRYDLPIGGDGWKVYLSKSLARYSLGDAFKPLRASGIADSWRAGVSYPLIRDRTTNVRLQLEGDISNLKDLLVTNGLELKKRSAGLTFTPSAEWQDKLLGGGSNTASLDVRYGQLNLGSTARTLDLPPTGPGVDGSFGKLVFNLQRRQPISKAIVLTAQWKQQVAASNLDSSEKLSVGGAQTMVAYPNSQSTADEGGVGKIELRWQALESLSLATFAEYAHLKLLHNPIAGAQTNHAHYSDVGFGLNWQALKNVDVAANIAWAGSQPPNPTDNDRPRIWADVGYSW